MSNDFGSEMKGVDANSTKKREAEGITEEEYVEESSIEEEEDEEDLDEISSELQELMQCLEPKTESSSETGLCLGRIHVQADGKHTRIVYRLFDTADKSYKRFNECRVLLGAQAKLRLLQTIGRCKTLRKILADDLTGNELEVLLTPMHSNPVLEYLYIWSENSSTAAKEYVERICEILGRILQTSRTLNGLRLYLWGITAAGARHLASGVRGNVESALEVLTVGKWEQSSVVNQVAEIVLSAPKLAELEVLEAGVIEDDGIDALAKALAHSTSLRRFELDGVERGASALLLKTLTGDGSSQPIVTLELKGVKQGVGVFLPLLLSGSQCWKELVCAYPKESPSPSQMRSVGKSLRYCSSLDILKIQVPWSSFRGEATDGEEALLSALDMKNSCFGLYLNSEHSVTRTCPLCSPSEWMDEEAKELLREVSIKKNPIIELHLHSTQLGDLNTMWASLAEAINNQGTHLSSLYLQMSWQLRGAKGGEVDTFFLALRGSSTLRLLTVDGGRGDYWPGGWTNLIDCLRCNTSITHLRLINCDDLDEDVFKHFMRVLQVNLTLKKIRLNGTSWETDAKKALIEEVLRRNVEKDSYFSTFRRHMIPFQPATSVRLFLCGAPLAGKTKLRQTMGRILRGSLLGDKFSRLPSTQGVEVEVLKDDKEMHIAVWDYSSHWIFHTLQDIMFPRSNHTSIFLFVFSPYDRFNRCMRENLSQCLKEEFEYWLRFIVSNSQWRILPKVLVVITHMDKMPDDHDLQWAISTVDKLGDEFQDILEVRKIPYIVNACTKQDVIHLTNYILHSFRDKILEPTICARITSLLAKRMENIKYRPLWPSKDFYSFCFRNLEGVIDPSLRPETPYGLEVFKAMAAYLHDTGSIIIVFRSRMLDRDLIIVDPNWFTTVFLGELITLSSKFQVDHSMVQKSILVSSKEGFVSSHDLHFLLKSFLRKHPEFLDLDGELLEELLIQSDLCYKLDSNASSQYYIPAIVYEDFNFQGLGTGRRTSRRSEPLHWSSPQESNQQFIGFRVECENRRRMSMTAALYTRFQIHMLQKLMTEMKLTAESVMFFKNYMRLQMDGHEILVEQNLAESHIDVLVKCAKNKPRGIAMTYIQVHIIEELRTFCASRKGCPRLSLVVGVLRTSCVEQLVPLSSRGNFQSIPIRKLKENFETYIMKRVKEIKIESSCGSNSLMLKYKHLWPPIPLHMPQSYELAKDLLPESEVESVTENVLVKHEQQLKLLDQLSKEMAEEMEQVQSVSDVVTEVGKLTKAPEVEDPCSSSTNTSIQPYTSQPIVGRELDCLEYQMVDLVRLSNLEHKMEDRFDGLEVTHRRIEMNVNKIITIQCQLESSVTTFMSKLDRMIGYAESWEYLRTPRRPYFNFEDVNIFCKMCVGTPVRLHLMCESLVGPHMVKDQPGLQLYLGKENMEWLQTIYNVSSRMLYYLGKSALHVILGLGEAVQELGTPALGYLPLLVANGVVENIRIDSNMLSPERFSGNFPLNEAWNHLRSSLEPHLKNRYTELFKLHRVKYLNLEEGRYAWVCDQCMTHGKTMEAWNASRQD